MRFAKLRDKKRQDPNNPATPLRYKQQNMLHGNTQHHTIHFKDTYDGDSAYALVPYLRLMDLFAPVHVTRPPGSLYTHSRISIHRNCGISSQVECKISEHSKAYYAMTDEKWKFIKDKESQIRTRVTKLDARRKIKLRRGRQLKTYTLEDDAPELFYELPKE